MAASVLVGGDREGLVLTLNAATTALLLAAAEQRVCSGAESRG